MLTAMLILMSAVTPAFAAEQEDWHVNVVYVWADESGEVKQYKTLVELENDLQREQHPQSICSAHDDNPQIVPFYVPCGNGQHGGKLTFNLYAYAYDQITGKILITYTLYNCSGCHQIFVYDKKYH